MQLTKIRAIAVLTAGLMLGAGSSFAQDNRSAPPKELVEYVREATLLGLKEGQIKEYASKAGWPDSATSEALAFRKAELERGPSPPPAKESNSGQPRTGLDRAAIARLGQSPDTDGYLIGAGDVLRIDVWDEPKASVGSTVVRADGRIGMPLLKEVEVVGLTPRQAETRITERLAALIPDADVTVVITGSNSKKIYAIGGVKKEGPVPYTYKMTVLQALSEAGGLNDYAKRRKIYILRLENGKEYRLPFDYDAVLKGHRMELNVPLQPGDTIVVPR